MSTEYNLHGDDFEPSAVALLLIDVVNDFDFPEGDRLLAAAIPIARQIVSLRHRAEQAGIPIIYANDNFGKWRSDFQAIVKHCLHHDAKGRELVNLLQPGPEHYFILKPRHSAFFSTSLEILLRRLGVQTVILAGVAGNNCILFTANDAYLRELNVIVPEDCIASNSPEDNSQALILMHQILKADTRPSSWLTESQLRDLAKQPDSAEPSSNETFNAMKGG